MNLLHSGLFLPPLHPCLFWLPDCTCLVLQVRFSPCICAPIIPFLYLSVSFICLLPSCRPSPQTALVVFLLLKWKSHPRLRLPCSNTKLCPARMSNRVSLSPACPPFLLLLVFDGPLTLSPVVSQAQTCTLFHVSFFSCCFSAVLLCEECFCEAGANLCLPD